MYRPRGYKKAERLLNKRAKKASWVKKGSYESYIMIPTTPGSELKTNIERKLKTLGLNDKIRFVEKPGRKFIDVLKMHNKIPAKTRCSDPDCLVGRNPKGGDCRKNEIIYQLKCEECGEEVDGAVKRPNIS